MMVGLTSHGMVTALVIGDLFRDGYREQGVAPPEVDVSWLGGRALVEVMVQPNRWPEVRDALREEGSLALRDEAVLIASEGKSSLEEVLRVCKTV